MSPPRRRSRRLRGNSASPVKTVDNTPNRLAALAERDETPTQGAQSTLDAIVSSPLAPRTPATSGYIKPAFEEMHPSQAQQSTTKAPDSGLRLGFTDINPKGDNQPSGVTQKTPSKLGIGTPSFDFRFARPGPQLGPEAQRMMDELREEALRIKAKLAAEREEEIHNGDEEITSNVGGRKIAQPKGKVGRFSDIHMAAFKRMDSIANHPSALRAQPGRSTPVTKSLKRTQSKAKLDEREDLEENVQKPVGQTPAKRNLKRALSKTRLDEKVEVEQNIQKFTERLENTAPAKRARQLITDDASSARPISREGGQSTPNTTRPQSSFLTTPTQASLARSAVVKHPGTSIPTLSRSPSKPNLGDTPRNLLRPTTTNTVSSLPKSESKGALPSPSRFDRMKSILKHPSWSAKKPSAIPSLTRSPSRPNLEKELRSVPTTPGGLQYSKSAKRVNFTPDTVNKHSATIQNSPSPFKSGLPRSTSKINMGLNFKPTTQSTNKEVQYPSITHHPSVGIQSNTVEYPSLASPRPLPEAPRQLKSVSRPQPSVPSTFTFRSDHTIDFGVSPKSFGSSPGQASVRQVRPSIFPGSMPGTFPDVNKENTDPMPSIPHGISNKKRHRIDSDDELEEDVERSPKKQKMNVTEGVTLVNSKIMAEKMAPVSKIPSPAKKKGLSLSRLNMLSRPKNRK